VLDAGLNPFAVISIEDEDWDRIKGTRSGVPTGALFTRRTLVELALMSSDNHAAHALARTYPGGMAGFLEATQRKIDRLGLENTGLVEPTGLSPRNHATAHDMAKIVRAAAAYPEIVRATSQASNRIKVNGQGRVFRNTNRFVGKPGWDISVSKTGFTHEAGRCLGMRLEAAGRKVLVVLMGAMAGSERAVDVMNVQRWVEGLQPEEAVKSAAVKTVAVKARGQRTTRRR
jgi:D-alanyl-D-alanine carboxypeptidase/D-alanyl-D-alanine endopeptidase (penicillin-binding protein 7)